MHRIAAGCCGAIVAACFLSGGWVHLVRPLRRVTAGRVDRSRRGSGAQATRQVIALTTLFYSGGGLALDGHGAEVVEGRWWGLHSQQAPPEHAALAMQFPWACQLLNWLRQASALAASIERESPDARVLVRVLCDSGAAGNVTGLARAAGVRGEGLGVSGELVAAATGRKYAGLRGQKYFSSQQFKWQVFGMDGVDAVLFLDLDTDPLPLRCPALSEREPGETSDCRDAVGTERRSGAAWAALLRCFMSAGLDAVVRPDHAGPVNGGFMIARPRRTLFESGIRVLSTAGFNTTHGWELMGPPRVWPTRAELRGIPLSSHRTPSWKFGAADADQGFLFHMLFQRGGARASFGSAGCRAVTGYEDALSVRGHGEYLVRHYIARPKPWFVVKPHTCPLRSDLGRKADGSGIAHAKAAASVVWARAALHRAGQGCERPGCSLLSGCRETWEGGLRCAAGATEVTAEVVARYEDKLQQRGAAGG
eukprot:TRINITY_DN19083_c0_g1_i1.p1 TRINITY_DN19083_c0_g1~~TRINITY_DN19083_c0_g1_i1.p1  ORF type:complete len:479 (+),score=86.32 TRINITY_DN19083_c0_g1_i1:34-1470(+)